jgi:predicted permease
VFGALILGLAFWVYRLRRGRSQEQQSQAALAATNNNGGGGYDPVPTSVAHQVHTDDPPYVKHEMFAGEPPKELPTSHGYYGGT